MPEDMDLKFTVAAAEDAFEPALVTGGSSLVVVDTSVADYQTLLAGLSADAEVLLVDGENGGFADLISALAGRSGLSSIQIISHGGEGTLAFGQDSVAADTLDDHADVFAAIGAALAEGGDLLLYGCDVAAGGAGQTFIDAIAEMTGADVAASDDLTGAAAAGGDWDLEIHSGDIEADAPFSAEALADFSGVLAIPGTIDFSTVGVQGEFNGVNTIDATVTDSGYTLVLDGEFGSTYAGFGRGYTGNAETKMTLSFSGGYEFTATSIYIYNVSGSADTFKITSDKGDTFTTGSYNDSAGGTINLTGFDDITKLYISAVDNYAYFSVDNLAISSIGLPNDPPTITGAPSDVTVTEDTASDLDLSAVVLDDPNGDSLTVTLAAGAGTMTASSGGGVTVGGSGTGSLTLSGAFGDINTFLDTTTNIKYTGASNANGNDATTLTITPNDGTVNGTAATVNIDITAVNDDPSGAGAPSDITVIEDTASSVDFSGISFTDVDGDTVTVKVSAGAGSFGLANPAPFSLSATGNGTGTFTLTGAIADIETYFDTASNVTYAGATNANGNDVTTIAVTINDGNGGGDIAVGTVNVDITAVNDAPAFAGLDGTPSFTEGGSAVVLDADVTVADIELDAAADFAGASLTIARNGGADASDSFAFGASGSFDVSGGNLQAGGLTFATFTNSGGTLTVDFTSSGTNATGALVDAVMQAITYQNTSDAPPANAQLDWTFSDGNSANAQGTGDNPGTVTGSTTVSITDMNDAPTLSATGVDPTFTEGGSAADLFSTVSTSTVESGQTISGLTLTVTNVADGASEILAADGTSIALTNGNSGTTATNGLTYSVAVSGGTATVTLSNGTMSEAATDTLIDGLGYQNTSDDPSTGSSRVVTITSLTDSGGGTDTAPLATASTVSLTPVNDAPVVGNVFGDSASQVVAGTGASNVADLDDATVSNADSADYNGGSLTIAQTSGTANGSWSVDGTNVTAGGDSAVAAGETISVGGVAIGTVHATDDGQGGNTLVISFDTANATSARIETLVQNLNYSAPSALGARDFTLTLNDGDGTANGGDEDASGSFTITVTPNPPVIGNLNGDSVTFTEDGGAVALDAGTAATVTDADSSNFDGGNVTVSYQSGQQAEDRIVVDTSGTVTLSSGMTANSIVSVGGTAIGTIETGATGGASEDLTITLNSDATPALVQTLIQALQYNNAGGDSPTDGDRVIRVSVSDAGSNAATGTADVTVNVDPVNDDPTATGIPADVTVTEDTASNVNISAISLSDDSGSNSVTITLTVSAGTMTASSSGGVTVGGTGTGALSLSGTIADIDTWLNTASNVQYTGAANAAGNDAATLTITANDGGNTGTGGGGNVTLGTVNIDITGVNDAPTSSGGSASGTTAQAVSFTSGNFNFADVDTGDTLTSIRIDTLPASGTLKLNGTDVTQNQVIAAADISKLTFTSANAGSFSFTYSVNDGTAFAAAPATMSVSVTVANRPPSFPTLSGSSVSENAKGAVIGSVVSVDPDGGPVSFKVSDSRFEIVGGSLKLKAGIALDFEAEASVPITITATDATGLARASNFTIGVIDVGEFTGGNTNDTLAGSDIDDLIFALGGDDIVNAGNGRDTIEAGFGNDTVFGGSDDDFLVGGQGNDSVDGGSGNDLVYAGAGDSGNDVVLGNTGDDTLGGGAGDDIVLGGEGGDLMWGRGGSDSLDGGTGDDYIWNGEGDDTVIGGDGNDTLQGSQGDDTLTGGEGSDTFIFGQTAGADTVTDFDVDADVLDLSVTVTDFTSLADVQAAASETTENGESGILIDLGGGNSVFLVGVSLGDLADMNLVV